MGRADVHALTTSRALLGFLNSGLVGNLEDAALDLADDVAATAGETLGFIDHRSRHGGLPSSRSVPQEYTTVARKQKSWYNVSATVVFVSRTRMLEPTNIQAWGPLLGSC